MYGESVFCNWAARDVSMPARCVLFAAFTRQLYICFPSKGIRLKCDLFRLQNTGSIMSRYNPEELIWAAMASAAAADDPGWIDIMDSFELLLQAMEAVMT